MLDNTNIRYRTDSCLVEFKGLTSGSFNDAIYIENEYEPRLNRYFKWHRRYLQKRVFNTYKGGFTNLIFIPHELKKLKRKKQLRYRFPFLKDEELKQLHCFGTEIMLQYLVDPDDARMLKPGFLFFRDKKPNGILIFEYYPLILYKCKVPSLKEQIKEILEAHHEKMERIRHEYEFTHGGERYGNGLFCTVSPEDDNTADRKFHEFDPKIANLMARLEKDVRELKQYGVSMSLLEKIIHQEDKLSRIVITKDNRIYLPDYNNIEIKMEPLVKAVYFLFLKHPEGIVFKHLPDYREELTNIYKKLRPWGLSEKTLQSIEDVTNPILNSINEKCARIRSAFVRHFDDHLASNYYITGDRGKEKKIALDSDLVEWE